MPGLSGLIAHATPILLIAASVYVSFRAGVVNIGAEGRMYIGAFVGALVAIHLGHGPGFVLIVSAFLSGAVAAAAWAFLPGVLYAYVGVDVLVSTLMFNYIAILLTAYFVDGPLRDPSGGVPQTEPIPESAHLPTFLGFGGANAGIFVALALTLGLGLVIARSRWGLQLRIIGENREFARTVGVTVRRKIVQIMLVSGAAAGVAGVVESLGTQFRFTQSFSPGFGFLGLTVALLGRLRPLGLVVAAGLGRRPHRPDDHRSRCDMNWLWSDAFFFAVVLQTAPLVLASTGGVFSQQANVLNIALDGMMLTGAFTAITVGAPRSTALGLRHSPRAALRSPSRWSSGSSPFTWERICSSRVSGSPPHRRHDRPAPLDDLPRPGFLPPAAFSAPVEAAPRRAAPRARARPGVRGAVGAGSARHPAPPGRAPRPQPHTVRSARSARWGRRRRLPSPPASLPGGSSWRRSPSPVCCAASRVRNSRWRPWASSSSA